MGHGRRTRQHVWRSTATNSPHQFFRLRPEIEETGTEPDGADLFGYNRIYAEELRAAGFLKPADFAATNRPSADYLSQMTFDPTTAKYWDGFAADPAVAKQPYDFRLNDAELAVFKKNGFVVSERLGSYSFADVFYRVLTDDLPVFISADAILHAWHFSYQRQQVPTALSDGTNVTKTLDLIRQLNFVMEFEIFGTNRMFDFSQFTVRGHYERSEALGRYFQAFMWTARADLRMLAAKPDAQTIRELGTAIVLCQMLQASGQADHWRELDDLIRLFVGRTDGMTFAQLQPRMCTPRLRTRSTRLAACCTKAREIRICS